MLGIFWCPVFFPYILFECQKNKGNRMNLCFFRSRTEEIMHIYSKPPLLCCHILLICMWKLHQRARLSRHLIYGYVREVETTLWSTKDLYLCITRPLKTCLEKEKGDSSESPVWAFLHNEAPSLTSDKHTLSELFVSSTSVSLLA